MAITLQEYYDLLVKASRDGNFPSVRDLDRYRANWDGDGAESVPLELIHTTLQFIELLEGEGYLPPASIYPLADGTVMIECVHSTGGMLSANIREPGRAEILYKFTDKDADFEVVAWATKKCAVGLLIPDDKYIPSMECGTVDDLFHDYPALKEYIPVGMTHNMLRNVQRIHDNLASHPVWDHTMFVALLSNEVCFRDCQKVEK